MSDVVAPDHPDDNQVAMTQVGAPAMPAVSPNTLHRRPYLISWDGRHSIGWQSTKRDGACFVVVWFNAMATAVVLDRFPLTQAGWDAAWAALAQRDAQSARRLRDVLEGLAPDEARKAEAERQAVMFEVFLRAQAIRTFPALDAQVLIGIDFVYTFGHHDPAAKTNTSQLLGRLAGAEAVVTDGSQAWSPGRAMFMPIGLTGLATKTVAHAAIIFSDGTSHVTALDGNQAVRDAQLQVVQFNALAGASAPPAPQADNDPASRLRKLQELLNAGLLNQDEYEAKRAEIIKLL